MPNDLLDLIANAMWLADSCARSDIESFCPQVERVDGTSKLRSWYDTSKKAGEDWLPRALRHLDARHMVIRHHEAPHLVRFG